MEVARVEIRGQLVESVLSSTMCILNSYPQAFTAKTFALLPSEPSHQPWNPLFVFKTGFQYGAVTGLELPEPPSPRLALVWKALFGPSSFVLFIFSKCVCVTRPLWNLLKKIHTDNTLELLQFL